jgi:hypothetical protein
MPTSELPTMTNSYIGIIETPGTTSGYLANKPTTNPLKSDATYGFM